MEPGGAGVARGMEARRRAPRPRPGPDPAAAAAGTSGEAEATAAGPPGVRRSGRQRRPRGGGDDTAAAAAAGLPPDPRMRRDPRGFFFDASKKLRPWTATAWIPERGRR